MVHPAPFARRRAEAFDRGVNGGFTLIELLIVVAIIGVLVALLLPVVGMVQRGARLSDLEHRVDAVTRALVALGTGGNNPVTALQREVPALGGVVAYRYDPGSGYMFGIYGKSPDVERSGGEGDWLDYAQPWNRMFPLGAERLVFPLVGFADPYGPEPEPADLGDFNPRLSFELLQVAGAFEGVADPAAAYATDRDPSRPWNDPWGGPLVAAYAMYQFGFDADHYPDLDKNGDFRVNHAGANGFGGYRGGERLDNYGYLFSRRLAAVDEHYRQTKALYVLVGSAGARRAAPYAGDAELAGAMEADRGAALQGLWDQIVSVITSDGEPDEQWVIDAERNAMLDPPWRGVVERSHDRRRAYCSLPQELR